MTMLWWIGSGEFLLMLGLLAVVLGLRWRQKRRQHLDIERLLEDVETRQALRRQQLTRRLQEHYGLTSESAAQLSESLMVAEKQFLRGFIDQQLHQASVSGFYEDFCGVLEAYYNALKTAGRESKTPKPQTASTGTDKQRQTTVTEVPDWGDVFD